MRETEDAQVFRYLPDGRLKIFSVSLSAALAGDPADNILLASARSAPGAPQSGRSQPATVTSKATWQARAAIR